MMSTTIGAGWDEYLAGELEKPYMQELKTWLKTHRPFYPPSQLVFNAFKHTSFEDVRVVILGQDPYHGPRQAMGLSFSVPDGVTIPPSLRNILKEVKKDLGVNGDADSGDLTPWADQGVLLLNSVLTVSPGKAASHAKQGWEQFTDKTIRVLSNEKEHLVFMLWGSHAQKKADVIDPAGHLLLKSVHPSPLSATRGWFGQHQFSKCNAWLKEHGLEPIKWDYWNNDAIS